MDKMVREFTLADIPKMKIDAQDFIELYNENKAMLLDARMPVETALWGVKFAKEIPYNELPDRLDELPKDKIIVCVCPQEYRANMAKEYLRFKGFEAKTLNGGLFALMDALKGGQAKNINVH
ncbi:hypothetical protein MNB_SM-3-268 [hydrothermal vent metagenome]|uniref:Rhodanese domain-containing protein n=1 Tax=hydrothermal vent metagenome TaxID=652676 RepID=A0A1W1BIP5_9ZZZZ